MKKKKKRLGRPALPKHLKRVGRTVRLPAAMWARVQKQGPVTPTVERALLMWLAVNHRSKKKVR